jgi:hypothetical protein
MRKLTFLAVIVATCLSGSVFAKEHKKQKDEGELVKWKDVPAAVQTTIQTNAAGAKIVEVHKQTKNGAVIFRGEVKEADGKLMQVAVSDNGTLIKVRPDNSRNKRKHKPLFGS